MDAHRLRAVLDRVIGEHGRVGIDSKFAQVINSLGACVEEPGATTDEELRIHLTELLTALRRARTNDMVESERRILVEIRGERFTGLGLAERINDAMSLKPFLAGRVKETMLEIADELQQFLSICATAQASLKKLGIEPPPLSAERFELAIMLPDKLVQGDLERVVKELRDWNTALRDLVPLVSSQTACVALRTHTARRFELSVPLDQPAALAIGTAIAGIYEMFGRIKVNRARAGELEREHYPPDVVKRLQDFEQQELIPQALTQIKEKFVAAFVRPDGSKPKDLNRVIDRTIRFMAMRIREGVEVELVGPYTIDTTAAAEQADRDLPHHVRQALQMAARPVSPAATREAAMRKPTTPAPRHGESTSSMTPVRPGEARAANVPLSEITGVREEPPAAAA